jgi:hypothetical protein
MKNIFQLLILISVSSFSQDILYKSISQYSYVNKEGDYLDLPPNAYPTSEFINGKALVTFLDDNTKAYINTEGEVLRRFPANETPLPPMQFIPIRENGKLGYQDYLGNWLIPPIWDDSKGFIGEFAIGTLSSELVVFNVEGEIILNVSKLAAFNSKDIFVSWPKEGIIKVQIGRAQNEILSQFVDLTGKKISDKIPGEVGSFSDGFAMIQEEPYGSCYFINTQGRKESKIPVADYYWHFNSGLAPQLIDGLWGYINTEGETVIANQYQFVTPFRGDYAAVSLNEPRARKSFYFEYPNIVSDGRGTYQIIDKTGEPINELYYLGVPEFLDGSVAKVRILAEDGESERTALIDLDDGGRIFDIDEPFELMYDYPIDETTTRYSP